MQKPEKYNTERTRLIDRYEEDNKAYFDVDEWDEIIPYYLQRMRYSEARAALRHAETLHPGEPVLDYHRVRMFSDTGQLKKAIKLADSLQNRLRSAAESARRDEADDADNVNLWADTLLLKGEILLKLNQDDAARDTFSTLLLPLFGEKSEAYADAANIYLNLNRTDAALDWIRQGLEEFPDNTEMLDMAAYCLGNAGKYREAAAYLRRVIDLDPYHDRAWIELGTLYFAMEEYDNAISCYDYATAINDDDTDAWKCKGDAYYAQQAYGKAAECYLRPADYNGARSASQLLAAADCYIQMDEYPEALSLFREILAMQPESSEAMEGVGLCEVVLKHGRSGIRYLRKALDINPESERAWFFLGQAYMDSGRVRSAIGAFSKCLRINPRQAAAHANMGVLHFDRHEFNAALRHFREAFLIAPDDTSIGNLHLAMALACFGAGDTQQFASELQLAQNQDADSYKHAIEVFPECAQYINPIL